jgi:hypothetical protein
MQWFPSGQPRTERTKFRNVLIRPLSSAAQRPGPSMARYVWRVRFVGGTPSLMPYRGTRDGHGIDQAELN